MAIWEFDTFTEEELKQIIHHCEALEELGIEQNEDMMRELRAEHGGRSEVE